MHLFAAGNGCRAGGEASALQDIARVPRLNDEEFNSAFDRLERRLQATGDDALEVDGGHKRECKRQSQASHRRAEQGVFKKLKSGCTQMFTGNAFEAFKVSLSETEGLQQRAAAG